MKPHLLRPSFFVWLIVPAAVYLAYLAFGLPHMIWSYEYRQVGPASTANPFAGRYYTRCTFVGPYGSFSRAASNGKCRLVSFFKKEANK